VNGIRLRHLAKIGPRPEINHLIACDADVTFAPMDALGDGLGGLDTSLVRPASEVASGSYNYFADGDLLLAKVTPCFENGKKAVANGLTNGVGFATSEVHVIRPDNRRVNRRYLLYVLSSEDFRADGMRSMTGAGGLRRVSEAAVLDYRPKVTDLETQKAIADFLDRETARIDQLIEKKQRILELLAEQKSGVVSKAVTVGLPERFDLEQTSSRFLPSVPVGWKVTRLKHLGRIRGGLTLGRTLPKETPTQATPYLRVANVQAGWIDLSDVAEIEATQSEVSRYSLRAGDILMNEGGDNDKLGRGAVWHAPFGPCLNQNHVFAVTPCNAQQAEWISLSTNAKYARDFFYFHSNQSTNLASICKTNLSEFPVALPPESELNQILERTKKRLGKIERLADTTRKSIDRMREFRSALITAAVTGQIDVATWGKQGTTDRRLDQIEEAMRA